MLHASRNFRLGRTSALSSLEILATELTEKQPEYAAFARFVLNKIETLDLKLLLPIAPREHTK